MALSTALRNMLEKVFKGIGNAEELTTLFSSVNNVPAANSTIICDGNGNYLQSFKDSIVAQHSSPAQATATKLTAMINRVITVTTSGDAVALPPSKAGLEIQVINHGANPCQVYGDNGAADTINDVATGTGISQMAGSSWVYSCVTAGAWYCMTGEGYSGSLATQSYVDGLTAQHTSPSQSTGVAITNMITRFATVQTDNDAATLPVSAPGMAVTVINAGAHILGVYPNAGGTTTETINALSANALYAQASAKVVTFFCCTAGQWHTLPA